ncbi:hypothetical protein ABBQ32_001823 [Trebouxia sp. C0010 RCD-2024]
MTGALPKWEAALDTFDRIKHKFRAPGQIEKALNSIALDERVLLFRGSDSDIVERLSPYDQVEGIGEAALLGMEEIRMLAAFAKQHMKKSHSVRLSELDPSQWGCIRKNAGLRLKPYTGEISGLELQPVTPFQWSEAPEGSQASHYLPHIGSHIQQILRDKKYAMYDARRYKTLLTVSGMQAELGFTVRGTTDAALVLQQSIAVGAAANGLRWLWELKRQLHTPTEEMPARTPSDSPSSSSSDATQENVVSLQSKAACQAMAALLLANIHAPDLKPAITLTDLRDSHSIFWLDGLNIMYYAAPDAATAWALTKALLVRDPEGHSNNQSLGQLPQSLEPFAKRQKLDVYGMRSSGGELEQLAGLADSLNSHEVKLSTAACMLKQLFGMPAFCTEEKPPRPVPFGIYI